MNGVEQQHREEYLEEFPVGVCMYGDGLLVQLRPVWDWWLSRSLRRDYIEMYAACTQKKPSSINAGVASLHFIVTVIDAAA